MRPAYLVPIAISGFALVSKRRDERIQLAKQRGTYLVPASDAHFSFDQNELQDAPASAGGQGGGPFSCREEKRAQGLSGAAKFAWETVAAIYPHGL